MLASSVLDRRLGALNDRQIGQLMSEEVAPDLLVFQPELTICCQATQRLFRSEKGSFSEDDLASQQQHPPCPKCGNEMLLRYGVDEPDFYECMSLR